jgi:hypothetical protein
VGRRVGPTLGCPVKGLAVGKLVGSKVSSLGPIAMLGMDVGVDCTGVMEGNVEGVVVGFELGLRVVGMLVVGAREGNKVVGDKLGWALGKAECGA